MRTPSRLFPALFTIIGILTVGIWFGLLIAGQLGLIGNLVFLGAAAWFFELYSAAQRNQISHSDSDADGMASRIEELEKEGTL